MEGVDGKFIVNIFRKRARMRRILDFRKREKKNDIFVFPEEDTRKSYRESSKDTEAEIYPDDTWHEQKVRVTSIKFHFISKIEPLSLQIARGITRFDTSLIIPSPVIGVLMVRFNSWKVREVSSVCSP